MAQSVRKESSPGRPTVPVEDLNDFRFTVSFPRSREKDLKKLASRQGLSISAFSRKATLESLDSQFEAE